MAEAHHSKLRAIWSEGGRALNYWMSVPTISTVEMINTLDYDSVLFDTQHAAADQKDIYNLLGAFNYATKTPIVRVQWNDPALIMKMLDSGAEAIMCPMINSREDAQRFVGACRYPPVGYRSFGPFRAGQIYGGGSRYHEVANRQIITIAQIETLTAIENIKEIVTTEGLDAVFIGPTDLSVSAGTGPTVNYEDQATDERHRFIVQEAHAAGLKVGMLTVNPLSRETEIVATWGADLISLGNDISLLRSVSLEALQHGRRIIRVQQ